MLPDRAGKYGFFDIVRHSGLDSREASKKLWKLTWQGRVTNDTFEALRKGIQNRFTPIDFQNMKPGGRRGSFNRWRSAHPLSGNWHAVDSGNREKDIIEKEEILKDRIRQLFIRYGIVFRELLKRELPLLRWKNLFRTLRLMELSGEILSGHFFKGISGLQFVSNAAFRMLGKPLPEDAVYWMNACDPASLCGVKHDITDQQFPPRISSAFMVFHGKKVVMVSRRNGKSLLIKVSPDHSPLFTYLSFLKVPLSRRFNPVHSVLVKKINDTAAAESEYFKPFKEFGFVKTYNGLELRKRY